MSQSRWKIIDSGAASAKENMEVDSRLLKGLDMSSCPILHLYEWESPSATYGHFIDPLAYFSKEVFSNHELQLAKRPTGGGIIFHTTDWAFSVLIPAGYSAYSMNTLENYAFVNTLVVEVIKRVTGRFAQLSLLVSEKTRLDDPCANFCMAKPTKYDVMLEGKKVGGGAQRRTKTGFLHQGTLSLALPNPIFLERVLLASHLVSKAMLENTYALLDNIPFAKNLLDARLLLKDSLKSVVESA